MALSETGFEAKRKAIDTNVETTDFGGHHFMLFQEPNYHYSSVALAAEQEKNGVKGKLIHLSCPELSVCISPCCLLSSTALHHQLA